MTADTWLLLKWQKELHFFVVKHSCSPNRSLPGPRRANAATADDDILNNQCCFSGLAIHCRRHRMFISVVFFIPSLLLNYEPLKWSFLRTMASCRCPANLNARLKKKKNCCQINAFIWSPEIELQWFSSSRLIFVIFCNSTQWEQLYSACLNSPMGSTL